VMYVGLDRFKDQFHHIVHLLLLLNHVRSPRSTHVAYVIDSEIVEKHCVPVTFLHLACNMASDVKINFGIFLCLE
jgi:hypothetical protein